MKKKIIAFTLVAGLLIAGTGTAIAGGFESDKGDLPGFKHKICERAGHWGFMRGDTGKFEGNWEAKFSQPEHLDRMAEKLSIPTEGRSQEEIAADVKAAMLEKKKDHLYKMAEKLSIPTEGRSQEEIAADVKAAMLEKKKDHLYKMAEKLSIPTEGRSQEEIAADVKAAMLEKKKDHLYKMAEKLNINTEGLTLEEVAEAVREACPKKNWKSVAPQEQ